MPELSPRYCVRCKDERLGREPHLCVDLAKRLKRRERQRDAILPMLALVRAGTMSLSGGAESIVTILAEMGVEND